MGSCLSIGVGGGGGGGDESPFLGSSPSTARVIAMDGSLKEFPAPSKASDAVLGSSSSSFLCSSDGIRIGEPVAALGSGDPLVSGELYFQIPVSMLGRKIAGADMAALALKGSTALASAVAKSPLRGHDRQKRHQRRRKVRISPLARVEEGDAAEILAGRRYERADRGVGSVEMGIWISRPVLKRGRGRSASRRSTPPHRRRAPLGTIEEEDAE